ncbi:nuclear transport factor 2 family protein [Pseudaestuariivita sp.]|uniref:nuclear transport factor 2 family protein n=1 Tax=Pseudaestuariivita sp. TaxID=2211669 RepID=UPI004058FF0A
MSALAALDAEALRYAEAVWYAREAVFEDMCHDAFAMTLTDAAGETQHWDKDAFVARVAAREAATGPAPHGIHAIDVAGPMARVHMWVEIPGTRFEDHLGFVQVGDKWKLLTKLCRVIPAA